MTRNEDGPGRAEMAALKWRHGTAAYGRSGGLAVVAVTAALALGACGGPISGSNTSHVASLAQTHSSGHSGSTTTAPTGDATRLLDEWATCMHGHGDPNQAPPTIASDKSIQIYIPEENDALSAAVHNGTAPCNQYLTAAQMALRNGQPLPQPPSDVQEVQFAECMRANGFATWPNPSGPDDTETNFRGTGIDPNSPQVNSASNKCDKQVGIQPVSESGLGDAGDIQVMSGPASGPPSGAFGGNGGSGANSGPIPVTGSSGSNSGAGGGG